MQMVGMNPGGSFGWRPKRIEETQSKSVIQATSHDTASGCLICEAFFPALRRPISVHFEGEKLKIASYNTSQFFRNNNGRLMKSPESIQALGQAILKLDADIVGLQEIGDRELLRGFNRAQLNGKYPTVIVFNPGSTSLQVGLVAKPHMQVLDVKRHRLPHGGRGVLEVTFATPNNYRFTVFIAHCLSMRGDEARMQQRRMREAQDIADILAKSLKEDPNRPFLLMGDLNALFDTESGQRFLDTIRLAKNPEIEKPLEEVMLKDGRAKPTEHSYSNQFPPVKLDYAYASPGILPNVISAFVPSSFKRKPWRDASDHLPLVTVVEEPDELPSTIAERLDLIA